MKETNNQYHNFMLLDSFISICSGKQDMSRFSALKQSLSEEFIEKKKLNTSSN